MEMSKIPEIGDRVVKPGYSGKITSFEMNRIVVDGVRYNQPSESVKVKTQVWPVLYSKEEFATLRWNTLFDFWDVSTIES